jgi:uncharacterized protein (TIGR02118 family)
VPPGRLRRPLRLIVLKLTYCLRRRPDLTVEEFQRYWREVHAPLVAERAEVLGIRRYVQVHTVHPELNDRFRARNDDSPEPFDGVAELWFDDLAALASDDVAAVRASAELLDDERNFIDLAASPLWLAEEHPIVG